MFKLTALRQGPGLVPPWPGPWLRGGLALICAALLLVLPQAGRTADRDRLIAYLEVTGFGVALDSIALAAADAPAMLGREAGDFGADWARVAEEAFDTAAMRDTALDILEATLDDDLLAHAAGFYASDLGQRLVAVENASHMMADEAAKSASGEALLARMPDDRRAVLEGLNAAVDSADTGVRAVQEIQFRFLMAASDAGVLEGGFDAATLRAFLEAGETELRAALQRAALTGAAYTYRDISTADLRAYRDALLHPTMQQVYELMNAVQYEIMADRFERLARRMADLHPGQEL